MNNMNKQRWKKGATVAKKTVRNTLVSAPPRVAVKKLAIAAVAGACLAASALSVPLAHADANGWVAAASSPSHEQLDWAWGPNQAVSESRAMAQCATLQRASDCRLLATGPDCVAVAWDADDPINHAHGASGGGREVVLRTATAAAGPHANDAEVRCS